jgi:hypothetical protein
MNLQSRFSVVALLVAIIGISSAAQANEAMVRSCHELVLDYASFRDQENAEKFAALFLPDGRLTIMGQSFAGRGAIAARVANRDGPIVRHMMSNIRIKPIDSTKAEGVSYALIFSAARGEGPGRISNVTAMGEYYDQFHYVDQRCYFVDRKFVASFLPVE